VSRDHVIKQTRSLGDGRQKVIRAYGHLVCELLAEVSRGILIWCRGRDGGDCAHSVGTYARRKACCSDGYGGIDQLIANVKAANRQSTCIVHGEQPTRGSKSTRHRHRSFVGEACFTFFST